MSRLGSVAGLGSKIPTIWRTLRPIGPAQAIAQVRHLLLGPAPPRRAPGAPAKLAVERPRTPFLEPPAHVQALAGGRIRLLETDFVLGETVDWETSVHGPLFAYHLHQHEYLRRAAFSPEERRDRILDWIEHHRAGVGWDPHPISLRLIAWGKLLLSEGALALEDADRRRVLDSMADQAETLARGLEIRLQANHLLSNRLSVVWAGLLLEGSASASWRAQATGLARELERQIHPDGGHEERSPMYHALLLENILDLLNLCRAEASRAPAFLVAALESNAARMLAALDLWTHPDGRIALFADAALDVAADPAALIDYARRLGVERIARDTPSVLPQTGYVRLANADLTLIASVAGPAPAHQPGHAHCDALSFELSVRGRRLISDTGLFEYVPGPRRDRARATASHSTISVDGEEQAEVWSAHRVGGRPEVRLLDASATRAAASCRGWSRPRTTHRRDFELEREGLVVRDRVAGPCHEIVSRFHFDPAWRVELVGDRRAHVTSVEAQDGSAPTRLAVELPEGLDWHVEEGSVYPSFGREASRLVLVGVGAEPGETVTRFRIVEDD